MNKYLLLLCSAFGLVVMSSCGKSEKVKNLRPQDGNITARSGVDLKNWIMKVR